MLRRLRPGNGETIEVKVKGLGLPLLLRRSLRARRFSLQVSEARRGAILTMPVYSSFAEADEFLSRHLDWLKERVAGLSEPVPFTHGAIVRRVAPPRDADGPGSRPRVRRPDGRTAGVKVVLGRLSRCRGVERGGLVGSPWPRRVHDPRAGTGEGDVGDARSSCWAHP